MMKTDFRNGRTTKNASQKITMANAQNSLAYDVPINAQVFVPVAASFICWALQKGWMATTVIADYPYWAFGYLYTILQSYAQNAVSSSITVPKCISFIGQALTQKIVRARNGHVTYKFNFAQDPNPLAVYAIGPTNSTNWNLFIPSGSIVNSVWQLGANPTTYTTEVGQNAWTSLLQFLEQSAMDQNGTMLDLVPATSLNKMTKDVSAFAVTFSDPGGGWGGVGGFGRQSYLEVPIYSPILSCFYTVNNAGIFDLNRYGRFTSSYSGDAMMLSAFASLFREKYFGGKIPITFKCIDINQIVEVYALVLSKALFLMLNHPQNESVFNAYTTQIDLENFTNQYICPLSLQEFTLCIRATVMNILKDTQVFVQALYPRQSTTSGANLFVACTACASTCALPGCTSMLLPKILAENLRSCTYAIIENGKNDRNPIIAMPILGAYNGDVLDSEDYGANYGSASFTNLRLPTFIPDPSITISVIDGTTSGGGVAFINDPQALNLLIQKFNNWLNESQIAGFMCKLISAGTDAGPTVLTNMNLTSYWTPVNQEAHKTNLMRKNYYENIREFTKLTKIGKKAEKPVPGWNLSPTERRFGVSERDRHLSTSPYALKQIQLFSFGAPPIGSVWETYQQFCVKPVINSVVENGLNTSNQAFRIAAQQQEFITLVPSVGASSTILTIAQMNDQFAAMMVGPRNVDIKGQAFEEMFDQLQSSGVGGIFSDIASAFGEVARVGIPLAVGALNAYTRKGIMPV